MGGLAGMPNRILLNDGQFIHPKSQTTLKPGDRLTINYAGGGGFGPPEWRDREKVEEDLAEELISHEASRDVYQLGRRK